MGISSEEGNFTVSRRYLLDRASNQRVVVVITLGVRKAFISTSGSREEVKNQTGKSAVKGETITLLKSVRLSSVMQ